MHNDQMIKKVREISLFVKKKNILWFIAIIYVVTWILWIATFKVNGFFRIIGISYHTPFKSLILKTLQYYKMLCINSYATLSSFLVIPSRLL